jgi:hypothetical protein
MSPKPVGPRLTSALDYWDVVLHDGSTVTIRAHAYREDKDDSVFVALMEGNPNYEQEILRIPTRAVRDVNGGWATPR